MKNYLLCTIEVPPHSVNDLSAFEVGLPSLRYHYQGLPSPYVRCIMFILQLLMLVAFVLHFPQLIFPG